MRYDTTLKTLFQAPPPQLLQLLVGGQAHYADRGISHGADAPSRPGRTPDGWASLPPGITKYQ